MARIHAMIVATALFTQCRMAECDVMIVDVNAGMWDDKATLTLVNNDTAAMRDLDLILHVNDNFDAEEIQLDIKVLTPDSLRYTERVALPVAARRPKDGQRHDIAIPYRRNVVFRRTGKYAVEITPVEGVSGVEAAGIHFQTTKQTE